MPAARPLALSPRRRISPRSPGEPHAGPAGPRAGASNPARRKGSRGRISRPERQLGLFGSESGVEERAGAAVAGAVLGAEGEGQRQAIQAEDALGKASPGESEYISPAPAPELTFPEGISTKYQPARYAELRLSPRVILQAGDKIRVSAGPYYEGRDATGNAVKIKMAEKGVMVFSSYCELGASRWIEAHGKAGFAALHVAPEENSSEIPGLVRRPYKVRKVRGSRQPRPGSGSL